MEIVQGSKQYEFVGETYSVLKLTGYYTGRRVKIDLSQIDEEMFEQLVVGNDDEEF